MVWKTGRRLVARELGLVLVEDRGDVVVDGHDASARPRSVVVVDCRGARAVCLEVAGRGVALVAVEGVLCLGRRLPLVAPDHVEPGAIEGEMEASDSGEQLRDGRAATGLTTGHWVVCGHVALR